jgi:hypothetical protein
MDALTVGLALVGVVVIGLLARRWRARSDERRRWSATRDRDWTTDELDALRAPTPTA